MKAVDELLAFARDSVSTIATDFLQGGPGYLGQVTGEELAGKEIKIAADAYLDGKLRRRFLETGLSVLTEESGLIEQPAGDLCWVVDPLDGSVNYLRGTGPSAISVALVQGTAVPLFGVVFSLDRGTLSWGGAGLGAYSDGSPIRASGARDIAGSIVCGGFPARFQTDDTHALSQYCSMIGRFSKVRMIGSAACSLLMVAEGRADAYFEEEIMLWDVAAGLAIVEGAGGVWRLTPRSENPYQCRVAAAAVGLWEEIERYGLA
jgi:myo-inositol-1(or 4)-monophosphatase